MSSKNEVISWLRLINTDKVGPVTFSKLIKQYGSAEAALSAIDQKREICTFEAAQLEYEKAQNLGIEIIIQTDERYPQKLLNIDDAPPLLYILGNAALLNHPLCVAVVGARNASINGRKLTAKIAYDLTENNVLVISGMARGIDGAAHKGAMYALNQQGPTIAVLGTGLDEIYPAENKQLYEQISQQGLIISELPLGTTAQISNFPRRNRIVSGLSNGVLVVEATDHSGSLITARQAAEQGKIIFAIPGTPNDARATGPNLLLKKGARLVENAADILEILNSCQTNPQLDLSGIEQKNLFLNTLDICQKTDDIPSISNNGSLSVLDYLTGEPTDLDEIIRTSGLAPASIAMQLVELELEDKIIRSPGNKIALNDKNMKVKR